MRAQASLAVRAVQLRGLGPQQRADAAASNAQVRVPTVQQTTRPAKSAVVKKAVRAFAAQLAARLGARPQQQGVQQSAAGLHQAELTQRSQHDQQAATTPAPAQPESNVMAQVMARPRRRF